MILHFIII